MQRDGADDTPAGIRLPRPTRDALRELLVTHEAYRSREVLTVVPPLAELALTLDGFASGRLRVTRGAGNRVFEADRKSLVCDLDLALTRVGTSLDQVAAPSLSEFRVHHVARLGRVFENRDDCRAMAETVRSILDQLTGADAVGAAWDDVVAAFADPGTENFLCALRIAQLAELARSRGHDWSSMEPTLSRGVKNDDLGESRLASMAEPPTDVIAAWVAFGNAHLKDGYLRVGQVQFFDKKFAPRDIRDGCPALVAHEEFEPAPELTDEIIAWSFGRIEAEAYVLARVEMAGERAQLPSAGTGPPILWARQFVSGLVEAAGFRLGGTRWLLLDGGYYFTADGGGRGQGFQDPVARKALKSFRPPTNEPTAYALRELEATFADALARGDTSAVRAATDVGWHRGASAIEDDAMRLALRARGFEVHWDTGPGGRFFSWEEPVRHFLKDRWAQAAIRESLFDAVVSIETPPHPLWLRHSSDTQLVEAAFAEAWTNNPDGSYTWRPGTVLRLAPSVAETFVVGSLPRRRWKELARAASTGQTAQEWWMRLRSSFDVLLNRAVRQRNAIIHGQGLVPEVIASVEPFVAQLTGYLAYLAIDAAEKGTDMDEELEEARSRLAASFEKLGSEPSGLALWPES